jgi:CRP-like cAMP-binding protein
MDFLTTILNEKIGIDINVIPDFLNIVTQKKFAKNEFLIQQGQKCNFIAFVKEGVFRSYVISGNEMQEFNNDFYMPHTITIALTSFLTDEKTNCNIQALTETEIYFITKSQLAFLINQNKEWVKLTKYIAENYFIRKCKRETSFLKDNALERFKVTLNLYPNIEQFVSQYHIASYLGIKPQSLSRIKSSHR